MATLSLQVDLVASTVEDDLKEHILHNYDKTTYPEDDIRLVYDVIYTECPIPDPSTGALVSKLREKQVRQTVLKPTGTIVYLIVSRHLRSIFLHSPPPPTPRDTCALFRLGTVTPLHARITALTKALLLHYIRVKPLPKSILS